MVSVVAYWGSALVLPGSMSGLAGCAGIVLAWIPPVLPVRPCSSSSLRPDAPAERLLGFFLAGESLRALGDPRLNGGDRWAIESWVGGEPGRGG